MKNGKKGYLKELEETWQRNKKECGTDDDDGDRSLKRPRGLRAPDLMHELMRLSVLWKDPRFDACTRALQEHGIVAGEYPSFHFTGREDPDVDALKQEIEGYRRRVDHELLERIRIRVDQGMAEYRACAEIAAEQGRPAASFPAAVDQLRHLLRKSGKRVRT
jgi:hypothetical protein